MPGTLPRLVLVRAAATDLDCQGRIGGRLDVPLCATGLEQAHRTAHELSGYRLGVLYHAPCQAAEQTAQIMAQEMDVKLKSDSALANLDFGLWHGKSLDELRETQPWLYRCWLEHPETVCPPEGEEFDVARRRIASFLKKAAARYHDQLIGAVVCAPVAALISHMYYGGDLGWLWSQQTGDASWQLLEVGEPALVGH
ncbi:MAG TPA: histidine phosphatase family protein [Pirellulaceae bacterium]|nr:histidine phosphatase family protein [Pirellulaceae bacterium]